MDPVIPHVLDWLRLPKNNRVKLKDFLRGKVSEADCRAYSLRERDFEKRDHLLFIKTTPPENVGTIPVFVVPVNRRQVAIDMCHRNAGHQGRDRTLSLLKGRFWLPGMATALCLSLQNCSRCKRFEAKCQLPRMEPIVYSTHGTGTHRLCRNGSYHVHQRKAGGEERTGSGGPLYPLCSGLRYEQPNGLHHSSSAV